MFLPPILIPAYNSSSLASLVAVRLRRNPTQALSEVETALEILRANGEDAYVIGEIIEGDDGVVLD